jgi:hypothetical protein
MRGNWVGGMGRQDIWRGLVDLWPI